MNRKDRIKVLRAELKSLLQEEKAEKLGKAQIRNETFDRAGDGSWEWRLIGGSPDLAKRNADMFRDWCSGISFAEIARKHGITGNRVEQIIYKVCRCLYRKKLGLNAVSSLPDNELRQILSQAFAQAEELLK